MCQTTYQSHRFPRSRASPPTGLGKGIGASGIVIPARSASPTRPPFASAQGTAPDHCSPPAPLRPGQKLARARRRPGDYPA